MTYIITPVNISAVIQPLKPPITLLICLDLCHNRLIHLCPHNHPQQRLVNNYQLIFFLYALDWNPSLAPIPQRHCFGAHVIIGWVALAGRSVRGAVDVEHWHPV